MNIKHVLPYCLLHSIHFMSDYPDNFVMYVHDADCHLLRQILQQYCFYINTVFSEGFKDGCHVSRGFKLEDPRC